jgi:hypothetical protein
VGRAFVRLDGMGQKDGMGFKFSRTWFGGLKSSGCMLTLFYSDDFYFLNLLSSVLFAYWISFSGLLWCLFKRV